MQDVAHQSLSQHWQGKPIVTSGKKGRWCSLTWERRNLKMTILLLKPSQRQKRTCHFSFGTIRAAAGSGSRKLANGSPAKRAPDYQLLSNFIYSQTVPRRKAMCQKKCGRKSIQPKPVSRLRRDWGSVGRSCFKTKVPGMGSCSKNVTDKRWRAICKQGGQAGRAIYNAHNNSTIDNGLNITPFCCP